MKGASRSEIGPCIGNAPNAQGRADRRLSNAIDDAAELIAANRLLRGQLAPLPEACRPFDEPTAYKVQRRVQEFLAIAGRGVIAGQKVGCTTEVMQRYLGIDHPCAGGVFATSVKERSGRFRVRDFCRAGVECELVARLIKDLARPGADYGRNEVMAAVGAWMPGIEIVDDRYLDYRTLDVWTLVADDFFNAACVIGDPVVLDAELASLTGCMTVNGQEVGRGTGRDILGDPLAALAWLANAKIRHGEPLAAGAFVFLGSMVRTQWVGPGDQVAISIDGLGSVAAEFE